MATTKPGLYPADGALCVVLSDVQALSISWSELEAVQRVPGQPNKYPKKTWQMMKPGENLVILSTEPLGADSTMISCRCLYNGEIWYVTGDPELDLVRWFKVVR